MAVFALNTPKHCILISVAVAVVIVFLLVLVFVKVRVFVFGFVFVFAVVVSQTLLPLRAPLCSGRGRRINQ